MKQSNKRLLSLLLLLGACCSQAFAADSNRPNILFILVDDQSPFDLKFYNPQSPLETPNIDRLAREGMVFDGAYHMGSFSGAVCTPSRHMIMSGRTVWHLPIAPQAMQKGLCPPNLEQQTIPAVFNRAGYATMRTCKQGNSYEAANKLFTVRHDATKRGGTPETGSALARRPRDGLSRAARGEQGHEAVPDLLRLLPPARRPRRHAGTAREIRRGQSHRPKPRRRPRIPSSRSCRRTISRRIPFTTAIRTCATRWPSAACGSGATSAPSATNWAASSRAARTSTSKSAACWRSSKRWANWTTPTSSTPPTTA